MPQTVDNSQSAICNLQSAESFIVCDDLVKIYKTGEIETVALAGLDLEVGQGEVLAVVGPSGSGKTTLLNVLGGLDRPTDGRVTVGGVDLLDLSTDGLMRYRRDVVGFVWQQNARNMLPYLTALQNVQLPMQLRGLGPRERHAHACELLEAVELADRMDHQPHALSGGEQQRVAVAIALANGPGLLLADEPTGSVDSQTAGVIVDLFRSLAHRYGVTVVIVTHDTSIAQHVDRTVAIYDGRTSFERVRRTAGDLVVGHEEYVIVNGDGRLQLPPELVERLGIAGRARIYLADDHLEIWPEENDQKPMTNDQ
jgi:ABC-type lipoprotein export system ATPase subunit